MDLASRIAVIALCALVASCASTTDRGTLAQLRNVKIEIRATSDFSPRRPSRR
jgi:hypothetical protein